MYFMKGNSMSLKVLFCSFSIFITITAIIKWIVAIVDADWSILSI